MSVCNMQLTCPRKSNKPYEKIKKKKLNSQQCLLSSYLKELQNLEFLGSVLFFTRMVL